MASNNNQPPSPQHSRVSSSSSNHSSNYELMPRQDPFSNVNRDIPSPRASFPFKKVQSGLKSQLSNKSINDSKSSIKSTPRKQQSDSKELIQAMGQLSSSKNVNQNTFEEEKSIGNEFRQEELSAKIKELSQKIRFLETSLQNQRLDFEMEKKANEIYNQAFGQIRQVMLSCHVQLQGESIEQAVDKISQLLKSPPKGQQLQIIEQMDKKITQLRAELLKSSQNNIMAIFNTEITEAHCLHLQIKNMNKQIATLKENLLKANQENQSNMNQLIHKESERKIVNIYHHNRQDSEEEELSPSHTKYKHKKRKSSSSSEHTEKSRILKNTENKIEQLVEGYKMMKEEYIKMDNTIQDLSSNQNSYQNMFLDLKADFKRSLEVKVQQIKQILIRPSSSQQKQAAKDIESKLNHLINTLSSPERVSLDKNSSADSAPQLKNVDAERKIIELENHNFKLQRKVKQLQLDKEELQRKIMNQAKFNKHIATYDLQIESIELKKRQNPTRKVELEEFLGSRSDLKEPTVEQLEGVENLVRSSSINKPHSSQSYHQSNSKSTQIENLHKRLEVYREAYKAKEARIIELQNAIYDHLHSRTVEQPLSKEQFKEKYEMYIANLKILLSDSKKENQMLRHELIKASELNISRANNDPDHNSLTLSDRTTKHPVSQTRMIARRPNNYESIQIKLFLQEQIQKIFLNLLDLYQKALRLWEQDQKFFTVSLLGCIKCLIKQGKAIKNRLFEQTLQKQFVREMLTELGISPN